MSVKLFRNLANQIKEIMGSEFGIIEASGEIIACSDETKVGQNYPLALEFMQSEEQFNVLTGVSFQKVYIKNKLQYTIYLKCESDDIRKELSLISLNIINIKTCYDEKFDKASFIKSTITGNILPGDIPSRAKELHIGYDIPRVVFLVKTKELIDTHVHDIILSLFPNKARDFVLILDEGNTALIKELRTKDDAREIQKIARIIIDTLNTESMVKAFVGIGTVVDDLKDLSRSYKEAEIALQVGGIFENNKFIVSYDKLGIGRLIYQLPIPLCELFLNEVFKNESLEALDAETILTTQKFFENDLNISETSRQLYVHRNTLVYRLDKIQKATGLDIRKFDDAITFKVALLVRRYIDIQNEAKDDKR